MVNSVSRGSNFR